MPRLAAVARELAVGEDAATMVEYCLMVSFIALVIFASVRTLGLNLIPGFTTVNTAFGS